MKQNDKPEFHEMSDRDLGLRLGQAIDQAVDERADPNLGRPAVVRIAERAEAKAKARQTRRTVGSVAASLALFAGVALGWNALKDASQLDAVTASQTNVDEAPADSGDDRRASPADFSTGPALKWTEVEAAPVLGLTMQSTGDGRVVGTGWVDGSDAQRLFVTSNGTEWALVDTPELYDISVSVSTSTWVMVGAPSEEDFGAREIYVSTDAGVTWTILPFEAEPTGVAELPYVAHTFNLQAAAGSAGVVVATLQRFSAIDVEALLIDKGLLNADQMVVAGNDVAGDRLSVEVMDRSTDDPESTVGQITTFTYSYEELGLASDGAGSVNPSGQETTEIYLSTGGKFELVRSVEGLGAGPISTDSRFFVTLFDDDLTLLTSRDGRTWSEVDGVEGLADVLVTYGDSAWGVASDANDSSSLWRSVAAGQWTRAATFEGLSTTGAVAVGPGGLAVVALPSSQFGNEEVVVRPENWIGWSSDGVSWGWQDAADVFRTEGAAEVSMVVGEGFVLAQVDDVPLGPDGEPPAAGEYIDAPSRWFRAEIG